MINIADWISSWSLGGKLSLLWFAIICGLIIFFASKLVQNLCVISAKTKINDSFIGGAFIAVITSSPELITEITQAWMGNPQTGIADDVGSNAFAIFLIAVAAVIFIRQMFLNKLKSFTKTSLWISAGAMGLFTVMLLINRDVIIGVKGTLAFGLIPLSFFIFWIISLIISYKKGDSDEISVTKVKNISVKQAVAYFCISGVLLIFTAVVLNWVVSSIEQGYGISKNISGGIFLAVSTSLPEIIVFFIMLRKGYLSGAILALVGSQIFNLGIPFFGDLVYNKDATFNVLGVGRVWPIALLASMMIILIAFQATFCKYFTKKRYYLIIPTLIIIGYLVGWILITVYWGG